MADGTISSVLKKSGKEIQAAWARELASSLPSAKGRISAIELEQQTAEFLALLSDAAQHAKGSDISASDFKPLREFLEGVSRSRAQQGFTSDETATFIFSIKRPLFEQLRAVAGKDTDTFAEETWKATTLLDTRSRLSRRHGKTSSTASSAKCWNSPPRW
jgi:rsbT co-antagonist protein RsbR